MLILEKPYISELFIDSIAKNDWVVLQNDVLAMTGIEEGAFRTITSDAAKEYYERIFYPIIYSNSENAINWVLDNLPKSNTSRYIKLFKDKIQFRQMLKDIYPDFYFKEVKYEDLAQLSTAELKFPLVIKPAVGFLSLGVYTVNNAEEWTGVLEKLNSEMQNAKKLYPDAVVNYSNFLIEEFIDGDEFAIDAYYDKNGEAVILNIFQHPFLNEKDVRDRIYVTSPEIMIKHMTKFNLILNDIGKFNDIRNFPVHVEMRLNEEGEIVPIEINPMRFAGWCTADLAYYAWKINVYEYFMLQKKPDWGNILSHASSTQYYFSMAEVSPDIDKKKLTGFEYDVWLANYSNVLEVRKINPQTNPLFAIIFGSTESQEEINKILQLNTKDYAIFS